VSDWRTLKLKYVTDAIFRGDAPTYADEGIRAVSQACIQDSGLILSRGRFHDASDTDRIKGWLRNGDVLVNSTGTGTLGRVALYNSSEQAFADGHVTILRDTQGRIEPRFLTYTLSIRQEELTVNCSEGSTNQIELSRSRLGGLALLMPPLAEQRAIADYLDRETARLAALVSVKERQLSLLAEKRRSLITRAVTRGLDPDAPRRESGLAWLGEVPGHWKVMHLKRVLALMDYGISESVNPEGAIAVLRMGDIQSGQIHFDNLGFVEDVDPCLLMEPGDLVFNRTNSLDQIGKVGLFRELQAFPVTFASYLVRLRCSNRITPEYLCYLLNCMTVLAWARSEALPAIGQANLNPNRYSYLRIALPPLEEQRAIVAHVEAETTKLDALRAATERTRALLKERRAALIAEAVTGRLAKGDAA